MRLIKILIIFNIFTVKSQEDFSQLTSALNLENLQFGEKPKIDLELKPNILQDGTFDSNSRINNKIFDKVNYNFDQQKNLQRVTFRFKNARSIEKYSEVIYNLLKDHYGDSNKKFKDGVPNTYKFQSDNFEFDLRTKYQNPTDNSGLTIRKINIIIKEMYDEFSKKTYLLPQNNSLFLETENGDELSVEFIGIIENKSKQLLMKIGSQSNNWKFLSEIIVLTSDGQTEKFDLSTKREINRDFGITEENTLFTMPRRLIEKIKNIDDVKFRVKGKSNYDFVLGPMQFQTYLKVLEALRNHE